MEIYILRHGSAENARGAMADADRALTDEGKERLRDVLEMAREAKVRPALILTSPLRRAFETAEVAFEVLGCDKKPVRTEVLVPESTPEKIWQEIRANKDADAVLLAGHEPLLSTFMGYLLGSPMLQVDLKKGALARIDVDKLSGDPRGLLKWLLVPKLAG